MSHIDTIARALDTMAFVCSSRTEKGEKVYYVKKEGYEAFRLAGSRFSFTESERARLAARGHDIHFPQYELIVEQKMSYSAIRSAVAQFAY